MQHDLLITSLNEKIGEEQAKKLIKLVKNCDTYLAKFKKEMAPLLEAINKDVKVGILFVEKENINGDSH